VNVTPDKRKVMLHSEKAILDALKQVSHIGCRMPGGSQDQNTQNMITVTSWLYDP
jgi:DNA mismatch repair ATPase MutL